jgi:hypothetical protein
MEPEPEDNDCKKKDNTKRCSVTLKTETTTTPSSSSRRTSSTSTVSSFLPDQRFQSIVSSCANLNDEDEGTRSFPNGGDMNNATFPSRKEDQAAVEEKEALLTKGSKDPFAQLGIQKISVAVYHPSDREIMAEYNAKRQTNELASDEMKKAVTFDDMFKNVIETVHPDDRGIFHFFLGTMLSRAKSWGSSPPAPGGDESVLMPVSRPVRIMNQKLGCYRYFECRSRLTQLENGLIIADGCSLDITQLREREDELEAKTSALQREIQHHQSTQSALHEAMNDIRETNQKLQQQNEELEKKTARYERAQSAGTPTTAQPTTTTTRPLSITVTSPSSKQKLKNKDIEDLLEDLTCLKQLLSVSKSGPENNNKWAKKIVEAMAEKLEAAAVREEDADADDEVSEISWAVRRTHLPYESWFV